MANWRNIDTPEKWWACVDEHWPTFLDMLRDNFGVREDRHLSYYIQSEAKVRPQRETGYSPTRYMAKAYEDLKKVDKSVSLLTTFLAFLELLRKHRRMVSLWGIFQEMWEDAPDNRSIHEYHGWGRFCDLCSEGMGIIGDLEGKVDA